MTTLEFDFFEYWDLIDRVVGIWPITTDEVDTAIIINQWLQVVADHGGHVDREQAHPYAVIEFDSPQELDVWILKYM